MIAEVAQLDAPWELPEAVADLIERVYEAQEVALLRRRRANRGLAETKAGGAGGDLWAVGAQHPPGGPQPELILLQLAAACGGAAGRTPDIEPAGQLSPAQSADCAGES